jgi:DNA-binding MarR family transcriptional regulator
MISTVNWMIDRVNFPVNSAAMRDRAESYLLHQRLGWRVSRLARILQSRLEAELAEARLTRLMWVVLCGLGEDGVETPSELADYIGITRASTSRLLSAMARRGLVLRGGAAGPDGRQVTLRLSAEGRALLARYRPRVDAFTAHFMNKLDPDQARVLMAALATLAAGETDDLTRL